MLTDLAKRCSDGTDAAAVRFLQLWRVFRREPSTQTHSIFACRKYAEGLAEQLGPSDR